MFQNSDGMLIPFASVELQVKNVGTVLDWREETEIAEVVYFLCHCLLSYNLLK
jgi:hypothetical protein